MKALEQILQRKMNRKEFLATLGLGAATVMGFSNLLNVLSGKHRSDGRGGSTGYGSSSYGGKKRA